MKNLTLYIFFHKNTFEENTKTFHIEHLKQSIRLFAVNEKIEKEYAPYIPKECIIKEWELPIYNPLYQMTNFYQNSGFLHIFWNKLHETSKYVGFAQYDMSIDASELLKIELSTMTDAADTVYVAFPYDSKILSEGPYPPRFWEECFLGPYNAFYGMRHTFESIKHIPLPLLHTFIIPSWLFSHIMPFVEKIIPTILRGLEWDTRHLAGTLERIFALTISCAFAEGKIKKFVHLNGVRTDIPGQRDSDSFRGLA
jgi:hypothetical protein